MLYIITAFAGVVVGTSIGYIIFRYVIKGIYKGMIEAAEKESEVLKEKKLLEVKAKYLNKKNELEKEAQQRNQKISQNEQRIRQREQQLNQRQEDINRNKKELEQQKQELESRNLQLENQRNLLAVKEDELNRMEEQELQKLEQEERPDALCVAFDLPAPTFRHLQYEGYKAQRKGMPEELAVQMPILKELLDAMGVYRMELEGYEAPTFRMDESITDFYAFTKDSFRMENYQYHPFDFKIPMAI